MGEMKLSLNMQSVNALRELAEAIPGTISDIEQIGADLRTYYAKVQFDLGEHMEDFEQMILILRKAELDAVEAAKVMPTMLGRKAAEIETYLRTHSSVSKN